jgi:hypothetical protein
MESHGGIILTGGKEELVEKSSRVTLSIRNPA